MIVIEFYVATLACEIADLKPGSDQMYKAVNKRGGLPRKGFCYCPVQNQVDEHLELLNQYHRRGASR